MTITTTVALAIQLSCAVAICTAAVFICFWGKKGQRNATLVLQKVRAERKVIAELLGEAIFLASQVNSINGEPFTGLAKTFQRYEQITEKVKAEDGEDK